MTTQQRKPTAGLCQMTQAHGAVSGLGLQPKLWDRPTSQGPRAWAPTQAQMSTLQFLALQPETYKLESVDSDSEPRCSGSFLLCRHTLRYFWKLHTVFSKKNCRKGYVGKGELQGDLEEQTGSTLASLGLQGFFICFLFNSTWKHWRFLRW